MSDKNTPKCSVVQHYGPDVQHLRSVIPKQVVKESGIKKGTVLKWSALDSNTLLAKVVA